MKKHFDITPFRPSKPNLMSIVMGVLGEWSRQYKRDLLPIDSVYHGFRDLSKKYPELFNELYFTKAGNIPYSKKLEDVLFFLGAGGVISVENPKFKYYKISEDTAKKIKSELIRDFGKDFGITVSTLAKYFDTVIKKYSLAEESF